MNPLSPIQTTSDYIIAERIHFGWSSSGKKLILWNALHRQELIETRFNWTFFLEVASFCNYIMCPCGTSLEVFLGKNTKCMAITTLLLDVGAVKLFCFVAIFNFNLEFFCTGSYKSESISIKASRLTSFSIFLFRQRAHGGSL